ncbi:MAG: hypothetical protein QXD04_06950, partial [Candidatus Bathyarchaeia archaeon]
SRATTVIWLRVVTMNRKSSSSSMGASNPASTPRRETDDKATIATKIRVLWGLRPPIRPSYG